MKTINVGIIGAGSIAERHIIGYLKNKNVRILSLSDVGKKRLDFLKNRYKIPYISTKYDTIIRDKNIDAVSICLPNYLHYIASKKAIKYGKHVLCEKPMAVNLAQAEEIAKDVGKSNKRFMVGFNNRFRIQSMILKKMIDEGKLGKIYHCEIHIQRRRGIPAIGSWFTQKEKSGGGCLIDIGSHFLDLAWWLSGKPKPASISGEVYSVFGKRKKYIFDEMWGKKDKNGGFNVEDMAVAFMKFKNGLTFTLENSWAANIEKEILSIKLLGDKAGAQWDAFGKLKIFTESRGKLTDILPKYKDNIWEDTFNVEIKHWIDCLRSGKKPEPSAEDSLTVQRMIDGIYKSSKIKKEIKIN